MKAKLIKITAFIAAIFVIFIVAKLMSGASGNAFSWSWFASIGDEKVKTEKTMSIPMYGNDARIYPFKYKQNECIAVTTSEGVGIHCFNIIK